MATDGISLIVQGPILASFTVKTFLTLKAEGTKCGDKNRDCEECELRVAVASCSWELRVAVASCELKT